MYAPKFGILVVFAFEKGLSNEALASALFRRCTVSEEIGTAGSLCRAQARSALLVEMAGGAMVGCCASQ